MSGEPTLPPVTVPDVPGHEDLELIGKGGSAEVYRAREIAFDRDVAVKVFGARLDDAAAAREFRRECLAIGQVGDHPAIIRVYSAGSTSDGRPYLTMELMEGSLADQVADGPLPPSEVIDIGIRLADAVATAHRAGVLHRDIKPANVLRSRFGALVLADFGVSVVSTSTTTETQLGLTLEHAAPEVLRGLPSTERSDVYSLASCLFRLSTGFAPFARLSREPGAVLVKLAYDRPPDPGVEGLPEGLESVLMAALQRDPARRPGSAEEFRDQLVTVKEEFGTRGDQPPVAVDPSARGTGRPRRRGIALALAALAAVGVAVAGTAMMRTGGDTERTAAGREGTATSLDGDELIQELSVLVADGTPDEIGPERQCVTAEFARLRPDALAAMVIGRAGSRSNIAAVRKALEACRIDAAVIAPLVAVGSYSEERPQLPQQHRECVDAWLAEGPALDIAAVAALTPSDHARSVDRLVDDHLSAALATCMDPAELVGAYATQLRRDGAAPETVATFEVCAPLVLPTMSAEERSLLGIGLLDLAGDGPLARSYQRAREMLAVNVAAFWGADADGAVQLGSGQSIPADGLAAGGVTEDGATVGQASSSVDDVVEASARCG